MSTQLEALRQRLDDRPTAIAVGAQSREAPPAVEFPGAGFRVPRTPSIDRELLGGRIRWGCVPLSVTRRVRPGRARVARP